MTWTHNFTAFYKLVLYFGLPLVNLYHILCGNIFLNTAAYDAEGFELLGNSALTPCHYLFVGQVAFPTDDQEVPYRLTHKFDYDSSWKTNTIGAILLLPSSLTWGTIFKGLAFLTESTRNRHTAIEKSIASTTVKSNKELYQTIGIRVNDDITIGSQAPTAGFSRRAGDEKHLSRDKEALLDVITLLESKQIPYWVDCGTCLGTYRYEGIIPWDNDIDIAILQPDFDNVKRALNELNPKEYAVQDWSSRDKAKTSLKVYARGTDVLIDIYVYKVDPNNKSLTYVISNEDNIFMTEEWRNRERKYTVPVSFDTIFPLQRAHFDGINVAVPHRIEDYLKVRYGENLDPIMVFDPKSNSYVKDTSHPYWSFIGEE
ncbi:MAG: LicD family protein [Chlamydiota bacterium]|nr:LicD family protein [Chlamydiota bacterium]